MQRHAAGMALHNTGCGYLDIRKSLFNLRRVQLKPASVLTVDSSNYRNTR